MRPALGGPWKAHQGGSGGVGPKHDQGLSHERNGSVLPTDKTLTKKASARETAKKVGERPPSCILTSCPFKPGN